MWGRLREATPLDGECLGILGIPPEMSHSGLVGEQADPSAPHACATWMAAGLGLSPPRRSLGFGDARVHQLLSHTCAAVAIPGVPGARVSAIVAL